jgi:cytochrome c-type biogenesis protein CcmE
LNSGDYEKWILAKQDEEYMPQLMKKAGYRTECEILATSGVPVANVVL